MGEMDINLVLNYNKHRVNMSGAELKTKILHLHQQLFFFFVAGFFFFWLLLLLGFPI